MDILTTRHYFAAPNLKIRLHLAALNANQSGQGDQQMFDGGDQRDEAARAGLTVDEFREWSELNGTPKCDNRRIAISSIPSPTFEAGCGFNAPVRSDG